MGLRPALIALWTLLSLLLRYCHTIEWHRNNVDHRSTNQFWLAMSHAGYIIYRPLSR